MKIAHAVQPFTDGESTLIPRRVIEDHRLSWTAKGLLTYLMSWPDGSEVPLPAPDSGEDVPAALAELEQHGYLSIGYGLITTRSGGQQQ
jgi:hypothetical protein